MGVEDLVAALRRKQLGGREALVAHRPSFERGAGAPGRGGAGARGRGGSRGGRDPERLAARARLSAGLWDPDTTLPPKWRAMAERRSEAGSRDSGAVAAPDPAAEVRRHRRVGRLAEAFSRLCKGRLGNKTFSHFEQWLFSRALHSGGGGADPVVPPGGASTLHDPELHRKLCLAGAEEVEASEVCEQMGLLCREIDLERSASVSGQPAAGPGVVRASEFEAGRSGAKIKIKLGGAKTEVNKAHWEKLQVLYRVHAGDAGLQGFEEDAFSLLMRYNAAAGATYKGGGMQAALRGECFDVLRDDFGVRMECFASPMNCRFPQFCSAFLDTDRRFGSLGSFFEFRPKWGSYEANPPFDPDFVRRMVEHMEELLGASERSLSFVVVFPHWPEKDCWRRVHTSRFNRRHHVIDKFAHGYFEGSQHNRSNRYRTANFDSSCFFLQNDAGAEKWPVTQEKLRRLSLAFVPALEAGAGDGAGPLTGPRGVRERPGGEEGDDAGSGRKRRKSRPSDRKGATEEPLFKR